MKQLPETSQCNRVPTTEAGGKEGRALEEIVDRGGVGGVGWGGVAPTFVKGAPESILLRQKDFSQLGR